MRTDASAEAAESPPVARGPRGLPVIDWSAAGVAELAPKVQAAPSGWRDNQPLPNVDAVVITWTSAEWDALHYVFSNALEPLPNSSSGNAKWRAKWTPYRRDFYQVYQSLWTRRLISAARNSAAGAPALFDNRWGSFCVVEIGSKKVLLFKSELHINQDGHSLPLEHLIGRIIEETTPKLILSIGTAGATRIDDVLGDVVVTNAAKFRLSDEFRTAAFNGESYVCEAWKPPEKYREAAMKLMMRVPEIEVLPPTAHYPAGSVLEGAARAPEIHLLPKVPILTTDFFEYGTTENGLGEEGCCVEMDDAVIAKVCEESARRVRYGFVRNISDPVINGKMPRALQTAWAVVTYQLKGLFTSYNGALATWAMLAG